MDSIKMANTGNSLVLFPPKPLSEKWGYGKNCPEELGRQEHQEDSVWVCVWLKRLLDLSAWSWAEEEEKQSRLFQQTGIQVWGEGKAGRQPRGKKR